MKSFSFTIFITSLMFLASCEDVSSNRKMGQNRNPQRNTQEIGGEGSTELRSQMHRKIGSPILSYAEEISKTLIGDLSDKLYRPVPLIEQDDEGTKTIITVNDLGRPDRNCGMGSEFRGIDARVLDCFQKNGDKSIWEGFRYGRAGEGTWKLVSKSEKGEMWIDMRTGMVWSYLRANEKGELSSNWCKASGNDENETTEIVIDCNKLSESESLCFGEELLEVQKQIKWRLPTRNDFLQADLNGLRFVLSSKDESLWTATIRASSEGRSEAWVYNTQEGTLTSALLSAKLQTRCIGAPLR